MPRMRHSLQVGCLATLLLVLLLSRATSSDLTILYFNDGHGRLAERRDRIGQLTGGGVARLATVVNGVRARFPGKNLFLHSGDMFSRSDPIVVWTRGAAEIDFFNRLTLDFFTPGNGEYYYSLANLKRQLARARFTPLAANVLEKETRTPPFAAYAIHEVAGKNIGILGVCTVFTDIPSGYDTEILEPSEVLPPLIDQIRPGVDLLILLSHLGLDKDKELLSRQAGLDLVVSAHSHELLATPAFALDSRQRAIPLVEAGKDYQAVGWVEVSFSTTHPAPHFAFHLRRLDESVPPDPGTLSVLEKIRAPLSRVVTRNRLNLNLALTKRLFLRVIERSTGARVNLLDQTAILSAISTGTLTIEQLCAIHPWRNRLMVSKMSPTQLRLALRTPELHIHGIPALFDFLENSRASETLEVGYPEYVHRYLPSLKIGTFRFVGLDLLEAAQIHLPELLDGNLLTPPARPFQSSPRHRRPDRAPDPPRPCDQPDLPG